MLPEAILLMLLEAMVGKSIIAGWDPAIYISIVSMLRGRYCFISLFPHCLRRMHCNRQTLVDNRITKEISQVYMTAELWQGANVMCCAMESLLETLQPYQC